MHKDNVRKLLNKCSKKELIENIGFLARFLFSSSEKLLSFFTISKKFKIIIKVKNI